ncbi:MAG: hypothetical protein J6M16_10685, partial [Clostridia bacterium]|nr:hypothetical protein [Clostridia bacterium]
ASATLNLKGSLIYNRHLNPHAFLVKSFAPLTVKSKTIAFGVKLNPPTAAAISHGEAIFHPPARVGLVEKDRFLSKPVFFSAKEQYNGAWI